jgi:uncharacterized DUF497 family protein
VEIEYDPAKRALTRERRGLDFARCVELFVEPHLTRADERMDYGEPRFISIGALGSDVVVVVWTPRGVARRIISMRKANGREKAFFRAYVARS